MNNRTGIIGTNETSHPACGRQPRMAPNGANSSSAKLSAMPSAMPSADPNIEVMEIDRAEIAVEPWRWEFAESRRDEIAQHFAERQRERSGIWNGRVLLLRDYTVRDRVLRGAAFIIDYASTLAWRDWNFPGEPVFNIFASGGLRAADGAYLLGEMGQATAGAGHLVFPGGMPDLTDIGPNGLDLDGSMKRELREETGLDIGMFEAQPGWTLARDRGYFAMIKRLSSRLTAQELRARILQHMAEEADPEFSDVRIIRGPDDFSPAIHNFLIAYFEYVWRQGDDRGQR
jgi:8-oxo-dGTP pyrophosphatase MutT (NUDIX family)